MKHFAEFIEALDRTNKTGERIEAIIDYFSKADDKDKLWTLYLFSGGKIKKSFKIPQLVKWAIEYSNYPEWLFNECYGNVGDLAETIALILPAGNSKSEEPLSYWIEYIKSSNSLGEEKRKELILTAWNKMNQNERFVFNKLITGGFRAGVSQKTIINAISKLENIEVNELSHRLMGKWHPDSATYRDLLFGNNYYLDSSKPYPFYLAYPIETDPEALGDKTQWHAEWKWDGIRGQLIFRNGELFIWSRGEELVTDRFPELQGVKAFLPDYIVFDGEILCFKDDKPMSFNVLQTRLGRKSVTHKILKDAPVVFMIYDVLEFNGNDVREMTFDERRKIIYDHKDQLLGGGCLKISDEIKFESWDELKRIREGSRGQNTEGIMLKRRSSPYGAGRKKGDWWKWKIDPYFVDAVLIYAMRGHGRRAGLYTDYTFGVWDEGRLVSFAKAYSGLDNREIREVDAFIRDNTLERFGPVRTVKPELVFEIAFEGISSSTRHKSGIAVRFPRISRWRKDKKIAEADSLQSLKGLLTKGR